MTPRHYPMVRQHGLSVLLFLASIVLCTLLVGVGMYYLLDIVSDHPTDSVQSSNQRSSGTSINTDVSAAAVARSSGAQPAGTTDEKLYPDTDPYELTRMAGASEDEIEQARQEADSELIDDSIEIDESQVDIVLEPESAPEEAVALEPELLNDSEGSIENPQADGADESESGEGSSPTTDASDASGDLIVAGRVMTTDGRGVNAMTVRLKRIGSSAQASATATQSNAEGAFRFNGLAPGDYSLMTMETGNFSAVTTIVKAGVTSAELRVAGRKQILINGLISGEDGAPIANARIQTPAGDGIISSASGQYRLSMVAEPDRSYSLRFNAQGYREETRHVHASTANKASTVNVDVQMVKAGGVSAEGTVISANGQPVVGATVWLTSPGLNVRGQAMTNDLGAFLIPGLKASDDYRIIVNRSGFARYQQNNLELDAQSLPLAIELKVLPVGNITGSITDVDGTPVPDFTINVVSVDSNGQALTVASDDNGYFQADGIPSGEIRFQTRSEPSISLTGLQLPEGQRVQADLVVDWGRFSIAGVVQSEAGEPYANARIIARWNGSRNGLISDSTRVTQTNTTGEFSFSELGPGVHEIIVESNGSYLQKSVDVDPRAQGSGVVTIKVDPIK